MNPPVQAVSREPHATDFLPSWASAWSLAVLSLAALAVLLAVLVGVRWLTLSFSVLGLAIMLVGHWARRGRSGVRDPFLLLLGGILNAAILFVTVFVPGVLNAFWAIDTPLPASDPHQLVAVPRDREHDKGEVLAETDWADASSQGIRQDGMFIRVGEVRAGRLPDKGTATFLLIQFHLDDIQARETNAFERFIPGQREPVLTDDSGQSYAFRGQRVRKAPTRFDTSLKIDDWLVFELPPASVQGLKLEIPTAAWGRQGVCRFRLGSVEPEETTPNTARLIAETRVLVRRQTGEPADPTLGRTLFVKHCYECHTLYGYGGKVGPDLTKSKRQELDFLLTSILDPSAVIEKEYKTTLIITTKGQALNGIIKQADEAAVSVQISSRIQVIPRKEIEDMQESKVSLMPTGLLAEFTDHEKRSLIAYLSAQSQGPMLATPENVFNFFFTGQDFHNWLCHGGPWEVKAGEIVAPGAESGKPALAESQLHLASDFHLTIRFQSGEEGRGAILIRDARRPEQPSGPRVEFATGEPLALVQMQDGRVLQRQKSSAVDNEVKGESWNKLEVIVADGRIRVRLNNQDALESTDPTPPTRRVIVLEGSEIAGQTLRFRDLDVRILSPK